MQWKFSDLVNKELFSFPMFIKRRKTNFLQKSATKQLLAYRYGVKKIFHSIVGSNSMVWVVRV